MPGVDVKIATIDGTKAALEALADGQLSFVAEYNPLFGETALDVVKKPCSTARSVESYIIVPSETFDSPEAAAEAPAGAPVLADANRPSRDGRVRGRARKGGPRTCTIRPVDPPRSRPEQREHAMSGSPPIVEMKDISIAFPGVKALDGVDFRLFHGEVHTLMGENGAGKSTLIKALTGVYRIDGGAIFVAGEHAASPRARRTRRAPASRRSTRRSTSARTSRSART